MKRRYIRIRELASTPTREGMLPVSGATVWRWVRDGTFPAPIKLGAGTTAWPIEAIEQFLERAQSQPDRQRGLLHTGVRR